MSVEVYVVVIERNDEDGHIDSVWSDPDYAAQRVEACSEVYFDGEALVETYELDHADE